METTIHSQRASKKPSEVIDSDLSKLGNNLITKFHVLMRISQIYDSKNVALHQFIQESLQTINALIKREGSFSLKIVKGDLFLNDQRLRYSVEGFTSFKFLLTQWKKRLIGEIIFKASLDERILKEFLYAFMNLEEGQKENATLFTEQLVNRDIHIIEVNPLEVSEEEGGKERLPSKKRTLRRSPKRYFLRRSERSKM